MERSRASPESGRHALRLIPKLWLSGIAHTGRWSRGGVLAQLCADVRLSDLGVPGTQEVPASPARGFINSYSAIASSAEGALASLT